MRSLLLVLVVVACAKKDDAVVTSAKPPEKGADPAGPCAESDNGKCLKRDPVYEAAKREAVELALDRGEVDTGLLPAVGAYSARFTLPKGTRVKLHIDGVGKGVTVTVRRWWPADDGWGVANDGFNTVEPGASFDQELETTGAEELLRVEVEPKSDLRVVVNRVNRVN